MERTAETATLAGDTLGILSKGHKIGWLSDAVANFIPRTDFSSVNVKEYGFLGTALVTEGKRTRVGAIFGVPSEHLTAKGQLTGYDVVAYKNGAQLMPPNEAQTALLAIHRREQMMQRLKTGSRPSM